jgi:hypothetical protein
LKAWLTLSAKVLGTLLLLSAFFFLPAPSAIAGEAEILLLHTNNVTGYLFPCPT